MDIFLPTVSDVAMTICNCGNVLTLKNVTVRLQPKSDIFSVSRNSSMTVHKTLNDPLYVSVFSIFKAQATPTKKLSQLRQPSAAIIKRKWRQKSRRYECLFWRYDVTSQIVPFIVMGHIYEKINHRKNSQIKTYCFKVRFIYFELIYCFFFRALVLHFNKETFCHRKILSKK